MVERLLWHLMHDTWPKFSFHTFRKIQCWQLIWGSYTVLAHGDEVLYISLPAKFRTTTPSCSLSCEKPQISWKQNLQSLKIAKQFFRPYCHWDHWGFGAHTLAFVKNLGWRLLRQSGDTKSISYLFQCLSIAVQRGNAISILSTSPRSLNVIV